LIIGIKQDSIPTNQLGIILKDRQMKKVVLWIGLITGALFYTLKDKKAEGN